MVDPGRLQVTGQYVRAIACWITKATDTHSEYVILVCVFFSHSINGFANAPNYYVYTYLACLFLPFLLPNYFCHTKFSAESPTIRR